MKKSIIYILLTLIFINTNAIAAVNYSIQSTQINNQLSQKLKKAELQNSENSYTTQCYDGIKMNTEQKEPSIIVPANVEFEAAALETLNTKYSKLGDRAVFYLNSDFNYKTKLIAPSGSKIIGMILISKSGGSKEKSPQLQVKFNKIITPNGHIIPILAQFKTEDLTGIISTNNTKNNENIIKKGNIEIKRNTQINLILNQPVTDCSNTPY